MTKALQPLADFLGLTTGVVTAWLFIAAVLLFGSVLRFLALSIGSRRRGASMRAPGRIEKESGDESPHSKMDARREKLGSLVVWWIGLLGIGLVAWGGVRVGAIVFAGLSAWGFVEYFRLAERLVPVRTGRSIAFLLIPFAYAGVWWNHDPWCAATVPVAGLLLLASRLIGAGMTRGYLATAGSLTWGIGLIVYLLSHAPRLLSLSSAANPAGGGAGWFLYLVFLTEADDIFQALWGRRFGRRRITPRISPNKSLEGLIGGVGSTLALGLILAPWLTPLADPWSVGGSEFKLSIPYAGAVVACLVISVAGFLGDLNMSALKRDAGVKDTGSCLPSQGGLLDRIDSLTFTAPVFYYFVRALYE